MINEAFFTTYGVFKNLLIEILKPPKGNLLKSFSLEIGTSYRDPILKKLDCILRAFKGRLQCQVGNFMMKSQKH